jgi:imidazolonepropionase
MLAVTGCSQLITLAGPARPRIRDELSELAIIEDGVLLVEGDRVAACGPRSELAIPADAERVDAAGRIVTPGFVDAHTHTVFAGSRAREFEMRATGESYQQITAKGGGIRATVRKTRAATEEELFDIAVKRAEWFLRCGTTTIEVKSGYGLTLPDELKILRVVARLGATGKIRCVPTFLGAHEIPDEFRSKPRDYVELIIKEMLPAVAAERLARYCDVFCEPGIFGLEYARAILLAARSLGFGLRMHADQLSDSSGAALAAELRVESADHLECTDFAGIEALAAAGVQPVFLPGSVYGLGSTTYADARAAIDAGCGIVLATDFNPGTSPTTSMPMVLSLAMTQMHLSAAEAIAAATINAAYSIGCGDDAGSLEPGKFADFVIHDCQDYREIPYYFGIEPASAVYLGGRCVFRR